MLPALLIAAVLTGAGAAAIAGDDDRSPTAAEREKFLEAFEKLGSDSYNERKAASETITGLGPPVLRLLEERKKSPDPEVEESVDRIIKAIRRGIAKRHIIRLIEETGIDDDPEEILKKYCSPKEEDRIYALMRLSVRHSAAGIPIIKEFLNDPSDKIKDMAITELRRVIKGKDVQIASLILEITGETPPEEEIIFDRIDAFLGFADYREKSLVEQLKNLGNRKIREMIFTRMVLAPRENFVFAFAAMLEDEDRFTRRYCAGGIEVIIREVIQKEGRESFSFEKSHMEKLAAVFSSRLSSSDPVVVHVAAGAIGRTGLKVGVDRLVELFNSKDIRTVRRSAIALGRMKADRAVPHLVGLLEKHNFEALPEAADALARIGDPQSFEPILKILGKKGVPFRELLLYALTHVDLKRSAAELIRFLSDSDVTLRSLAVDKLVTALRLYPEIRDDSFPALFKAVREGSQEAKNAAARVLGEAGGAIILPDLKKLHSDGTPQVRSAVMMPIAMIAQKGAREFLVKSLADTDYQVRVHAAAALGYLGDWSSFLDIRLLPLEIKGDSVVDGLRKMSLATGMNLIIDPGAIRMSSLDTCMIRTQLKGKTVSEALKILEKNFGISWDSSNYALFVTVKARKGILDKFKPPTAPVGCTKADLEVEKKLAKRISCNSVSEGLKVFLEKIESISGIIISIDQSVETRLAEPIMTLDFYASDIPVGELLRLVLAPRGLSGAIIKGRLVISSGS